MEIVIQDKPDISWDRLLEESELGTIYQSRIYASYLQKVQGRKPLFIKFLSNKEVKAMALIFLSSQFLSSRIYNPFTSPLFTLLSKVKPFYWSFYGPVIFTKDFGEIEDFLRYLHSSLFKENAKIVLTPPPLYNEPDPFLAQGYHDRLLMTSIIDLRQDFDVLKKDMDKKSALKNAERALKRGVQVLEITQPNDFKTYYLLTVESRKRLGIRPYTWREQLPFLDWIRKGVMKCFIATKGEKLLAGIMISTFNGYLNEWGAAQALEDMSGHFYGNDLLRYHIIEWGHYTGHRFYDQSGLQISTKKDLAIFKYKTKWGGKIIHYNTYMR